MKLGHGKRIIAVILARRESHSKTIVKEKRRIGTAVAESKL